MIEWNMCFLTNANVRKMHVMIFNIHERVKPRHQLGRLARAKIAVVVKREPYNDCRSRVSRNTPCSVTVSSYPYVLYMNIKLRNNVHPLEAPTASGFAMNHTNQPG
jgi:hypothetical protein